MNIGNITSNGMNLNTSGKDMQIELYEKEIERLNNIINELEKILTEEYDYCDKHIDPAFGTGMGVAKRTLDKIKDLKEDK